MSNTILIGLSRQSVLRQQMDIVANNLANVSTVGYKAEAPVFDDFIVDPADTSRPRDDLHFVRDYGNYRNLSEGKFEKTGRPLDLAISGLAYFRVGTEEGERFTRSGSFQLSADGELITPTGNSILDNGGQPIQIDPNVETITIASDGTISTEDGPIGQIGVVQFENNLALKKTGDGLYETDQQPEEAEEASVLQGMLEGSNVQPILEMTRLIEINRAYGQASTLLETSAELTRRAIQTIGGGN